MKLDTFFKKFDLFADAPNAVAKMRELVLQLAATGQIAHSSRVEWRQGYLREVVQLISGQHLLAGEHNADGRGVPYLTGPSDFGESSPIPTRWTEHAKVMAQPGDILITVKGSGVGKTNLLLDQPTSIGRQLMAIRVSGADRDFVHIILKRAAEHFQASKTGIAIPGIGREDVLGLAMPLPPLAEQKRIVAKVDELMALCDRLEQQQQERETRHTALARASLSRFAEAPTPSNLNLLFHSAFSIQPSDLRKSILTLAFQGKLVPQDPNNEPASALLEFARAEKTRLIKAGVVKKEPWADELQHPSSLYDLPLGWKWTHVSDVVEKVTVGFVGSMKAQYRDRGVPFLRCQNVRVNRYEPLGMTFISEEFHRSISKSTLRPGDVVVTRSGNVGVTCVIPDNLPEANCSDLVIVKRPLALVPSFLSYFINSIAAGQIKAKTVGVALTHFNTQSVAQMTVPLPPLPEQRRIVAKVDQLMALVDQLEAQLTASRTTAEKLMEALVFELTAYPETKSQSTLSRICGNTPRIGTTSTSSRKQIPPGDTQLQSTLVP